MSEIFDEIDEEVRREQLKKLWEKYSLFIIGAALLVIAAVGGWRGYQYLEAKKAAEIGDAFNKAAELSTQNKRAEAEAAFADLAAKAPSGYRMLARLRAAGEAADRSVGTVEQALARIRAAGLLLDTASYNDVQQRLQSDAAPDATFRHAARELLALSAYRANDATAARKWLDMI